MLSCCILWRGPENNIRLPSPRRHADERGCQERCFARSRRRHSGASVGNRRSRACQAGLQRPHPQQRRRPLGCAARLRLPRAGAAPAARYMQGIHDQACYCLSDLSTEGS